jgi:hypothetical protein
VDSGEDLFLRVIQKLDVGGVLQQLVLVGNCVLPIGSATYYEAKVRETDWLRRPPRVRHDEVFRTEILRTWEEKSRVHGVRKVWRQLNRDEIWVARCTKDSPDTAPPQKTRRRPAIRGDFTARDRRPAMKLLGPEPTPFDEAACPSSLSRLVPS